MIVLLVLVAMLPLIMCALALQAHPSADVE
jgi:hypothetical protein